MLAWQEIDLREDPDEPRYSGDPAELIEVTTFLEELTQRPAWHAQAACRGRGSEPWFPNRGEDVRPAKALCAACPVRDECLSYAVDQGAALHGVWGGASDRERKRLRRSVAA